MSRAAFHPVLVALAAALGACQVGVDANTSGQMQFQVANGNSAPSSATTPETVQVGSDVIVFESVQLVLREIELKRTDDVCSDDTETSSASDDDCEEVEFGPVLLDLPLGGGTDRTFTAQIAAGTYDEIEFELHKPDDGNAADQAFVQQNPAFADASIRITGTWNGEPFTYTSDLDVEQEIELTAPLVITDGTASLTLSVDIGKWFLAADGTGLVSPSLALNGLAFEGLVENNIKASFKAFEDDDHDGSIDD